jgi:hypothetical protein
MITIDGTPIQDPAKYNDGYEQFTTDNRSLNLKLQRNRLGKTRFADMSFAFNTPAEIQELLDLFNDGDEVAFSNNASSLEGGTFAFNGIPDLPLDIGDYEGGGTYLRRLRVVLREV